MRLPGRAFRAGLALALILLASCFPEDEAPPPAVSRERAAAARPLPPEPSTFKVDMKFTFDLPEKTAAELGLPARFKGAMLMDLRAEALDPGGRRTRLTGKLDLSITDLEGKRSFAQVNTAIGGESTESPDVVASRGWTQALEALMTLGKGLPPSANFKGEGKGGMNTAPAEPPKNRP
jgi:hypothetical protein